MPGANNQRSNRKTHRDAIVAILAAERGNWVAAFRLAEAGGLQWQTRVHEARHKLKLAIENYTVHRDGQVHSFYRLVLGAPTPPLVPSTTPDDRLPLFPDLKPSTWRDPEESGHQGRR